MTFFYDLNRRLADIDQPQKQLNEGAVQEKIEPPIKTNPAERGKYQGKDISDLKAMKAANLKKTAGYRERGENVPDELKGKTAELNFAIRAKQAHGGKWGKIKEQDVAENYSDIEEVSRGEYIKQLDKKTKGPFKAFGQTFDQNEPVDESKDKELDDWYGIGKDSKTKGTVHKGTYGTEYQGEPDDEDDDGKKKKKPVAAPGEKRGRGRPKGTGKKIGAKGPSGKSKLTREGEMDDMIDVHDVGEYDHEGDMARDDLSTIEAAAEELRSILTADENLPEWVQSKINKAADYIDTARDYMLAQKDNHDDVPLDEKARNKYAIGMAAAMKSTGDKPPLKKSTITKAHEIAKGIDEESTETRDARAEKAGRRVAHDIEYDERKKDNIHGKRRGSEDDKAEKAGKKVTKDIEYDEKKSRKSKKEVDETTTSGSVATGGDAAPKGKKGMTFGKGIYDSYNREVENLIAESMSVSVNSSTDESGETHHTVNVNATDEDALKLATLLSMAGLGGHHAHDEVCPDCGHNPCSCDQQMDEAYGDTDETLNQPDWPTDQTGSDDALQYSGGLNKPKVTGQTTIPVTGVQPAQSAAMYETDDLARLREMAGIAEELKPSDVPAYVRKARGEAPKSLADLEAERNQGPTTAAGLRQKAIDLGIEDPDQPTEEGVAGGALGAVIGGGLTKSVGGAVTGAKIGSAAQNMIKHQAVKENLLKELSQYKS